jgi:hypothetical protein
MEHEYLTVGQLAHMMGVKPRWVYGHIANIPHVRFGPKTIRFDLKSQQLQQWLASCENEPDAQHPPQTLSIA